MYNNMTVKDLKELLENVSDNMPIVIPVISEDDANYIVGFRHVRTAGILKDELNYDPTTRVALCLNAAADGFDISNQIDMYGKDYIFCERVLYPCEKVENAVSEVIND